MPGPGRRGADAVLWLALALAAALLVGAVAGLFNGIAIAIFGLPPILATLGSGLIFTGFAVALTGGSADHGLSGGGRLDRQRHGARHAGAADPVCACWRRASPSS